MISKSSFNSLFTSNLRKKICKGTIVPYDKPITKEEFFDAINKLYNDIINHQYCPSIPREYLFVHKTEFVPRIIPVFNYIDESCYYFVCKMLEDDIANNRVERYIWRMENRK